MTASLEISPNSDLGIHIQFPALVNTNRMECVEVIGTLNPPAYLIAEQINEEQS